MRLLNKRKKILISVFIVFLFIIFIVILYILLFYKKEAAIIKRDINKEDIIENYDSFYEKVKFGLYRQGDPEQIYMAENPKLPFSEIVTYTSNISLDKSLESVKNCNDIVLDYFSENEYSIHYSEEEISVKRVNDDYEIITLYFTNKTGSPSYPDCGKAVFSKCENISLIIFKPNQDLYCSVVGRDISISDLLEVVQSLEKRIDT